MGNSHISPGHWIADCNMFRDGWPLGAGPNNGEEVTHPAVNQTGKLTGLARIQRRNRAAAAKTKLRSIAVAQRLEAHRAMLDGLNALADWCAMQEDIRTAVQSIGQ